MKNIWKYLIIVFGLFFLIGCGEKPEEPVEPEIPEEQPEEPETPKENLYNVKLIINDELLDFVSFVTEYQIKENESFTLPKIQSQTYNTFEEIVSNDIIEYTCHENKLTIVGWVCNNKAVTEPSVVITKDTTFELKYRIDKSISNKTIKVTLNDGVMNSLSTNEEGVVVLPNPTKDNYDFVGWYTNPNFISSTVTEVDFDEFDKQYNLYAKFTLNPEHVKSVIDNLSLNPTIDDIIAIEEAQDLYEKVPTNKRDQVTNYDKLENLNAMLDRLYEAKEIYDALNYLYNTELKIQMKDQVKELESKLETIDPELFSLMPALDLTKFYDIVDQIDAILELYAQDAKLFDIEVVKIPIFMEQYYSQEIKALYQKYHEFNDEMKALVTSYHKLERLYQALLELENSTETIYYLNPTTLNNVYLSKDQLCEAFFTDFYYYIIAYHGAAHLENNNLYTVDDFVELSQNFTGAGANNLYGIGNIAGRYMLEKEINGILENQTDKAFFGFCYQNNIYRDVLPFFINFFAYWRIDEGYANQSNYGADIFAESWAPTVDIAKFFYYDEKTSYVKTDRMIDCLTNTASVVYGMDDNMQNLRLRGYKFMGWYDNPEFSGTPVTDLTGHKALYAKWVEDVAQRDADAANLVDVYIYNLTTKKAVVNETTVGYVKDMYNNLSTNAKELVKKYDTLVEYINQYQ